MSFLSPHHFWDLAHRRNNNPAGADTVLPKSHPLTVALRKAKTVLTHPDKAAMRLAQYMPRVSWARQWGFADFYATPAFCDNGDRVALLIGTYEKEERQLLAQFDPASVIIELGSNIGFMARHAIKSKLEKGGMYVCVEGNPVVQDALRHNMIATVSRYPGHSFQIVRAVVSGPENHGQNVRFVLRPGMDSGMSETLNTTAQDKIIDVQALSLGNIIDDYAPVGQRVSLICDIEGAEIGLVRHPRMFDRVNQIAIELHRPQHTGCSETPEDVLQSFAGMGFRPVTQAKNSDCYLLKCIPA
jgi:FkbM family methyltransferase